MLETRRAALSRSRFSATGRLTRAEASEAVAVRVRGRWRFASVLAYRCLLQQGLINKGAARISISLPGCSLLFSAALRGTHAGNREPFLLRPPRSFRTALGRHSRA